MISGTGTYFGLNQVHLFSLHIITITFSQRLQISYRAEELCD